MSEHEIYLNAIHLLGELSNLTTRLSTPDASVIAAHYFKENVPSGYALGIKDPRYKLAYSTINFPVRHIYETIKKQLGLTFEYGDEKSNYFLSILEVYCLHFGTPERVEGACKVLTLLTLIFSQLLRKANTEAKGAESCKL